MTLANTTTLSNAIKTQYERRLLTRALPRLVHGRWARKATLSKYGSYELRKYSGLSAVTTSLTEGTTPVEQSAPTITTVTFTPNYYGAWLGFTDEVEMEAYDPVVSEFTAILGEQAGLSADTIIRDALVSGATVDYSADQTSRGALDAPAHNINYIDLLKQYAALEAENALAVDGDDYVVIVHPHTFASLMQDPTFVNLFIRESDSAIRNGYLGRLLRMRFYMSSNAKEWTDAGAGSTTDVYGALIIGDESFGAVGMAGLMPKDVDNQSDAGRNMTGMKVKPVEIILKQVGSSGATDPLNQRGTLAWKMALDVEVLNSSWIRCLEHTNAFSDD